MILYVTRTLAQAGDGVGDYPYPLRRRGLLGPENANAVVLQQAPVDTRLDNSLDLASRSVGVAMGVMSLEQSRDMSGLQLQCR